MAEAPAQQTQQTQQAQQTQQTQQTQQAQQAQAHQSLCLIMIVKNEKHVIERSLNSILPFVDSWCIVDTGSTDSTMEQIKATTAAHNKPGILHERPWVNFGHNRTELLELGRSTDAKWFFMLDADDIVIPNGKEQFKNLLNPTFDTYHITLKRGSLTYKRPVIFNSRPWVFKGALHEYAHLDNARHADLPRVTIDARVEGARSQNPNKYLDDAVLIEADFVKNPDPRSAFYCAQSWRDCGNNEKAVEWYIKRTTMGGWHQEIYIAYLNLVRLSQDLETKLRYAWAALDVSPRVEATQAVLEYMRQKGIWSKQGYALAINTAQAVSKKTNWADDLFVEEGLVFKLYDEVCIHSFYTGHHESCILYGMKAYFMAPDHEKARVLNNVKFSIDKI